MLTPSSFSVNAWRILTLWFRNNRNQSSGRPRQRRARVQSRQIFGGADRQGLHAEPRLHQERLRCEEVGGAGVPGAGGERAARRTTEEGQHGKASRCDGAAEVLTAGRVSWTWIYRLMRVDAMALRAADAVPGI